MTNRLEVIGSLVDSMQTIITYINPVVAIQLILDNKNQILTDTIAITGFIDVVINKNLVEVISPEELMSLGLNKILTDSVSSADTPSVQLNKGVSDSAAASDQILQFTNTALNTAVLNTHALLQGADQELIDNLIISLN